MGSKKFAAYSTGPPPWMSSDAFRLAEAVVVACRTYDARRAWVVLPHRVAGLALRGVYDLERRGGARLAHHLVACR